MTMIFESEQENVSACHIHVWYPNCCWLYT